MPRLSAGPGNQGHNTQALNKERWGRRESAPRCIRWSAGRCPQGGSPASVFVGLRHPIESGWVISARLPPLGVADADDEDTCRRHAIELPVVASARLPEPVDGAEARMGELAHPQGWTEVLQSALRVAAGGRREIWRDLREPGKSFGTMPWRVRWPSSAFALICGDLISYRSHEGRGLWRTSDRTQQVGRGLGAQARWSVGAPALAAVSRAGVRAT